jgi:hypothetical protein
LKLYGANIYYLHPLDRLTHNHQFWLTGSLRCVLVAQKSPAGYVVQVLNFANPLASERCDTVEHAAALAKHFWSEFVDEGR